MKKKDTRMLRRLMRIERKCDVILTYLRVEKYDERELDSLIDKMKETAKNMTQASR